MDGLTIDEKLLPFTIIQVDRHFAYHHETIVEVFSKITWKEDISEYSKEELEQNFNEETEEVNENILTEEQRNCFESIYQLGTEDTPAEENTSKPAEENTSEPAEENIPNKQV